MKIVVSHKSFLIISMIILSLAFSSCHKEGLGGNASITGTVYHHTVAIPNCIVYIKFDATEFPGENPGLYNASVQADSKGEYIFQKVYKGDYYLYAVGNDETIKEVVRGGVHVKTKRNKMITQDIPVTED